MQLESPGKGRVQRDGLIFRRLKNLIVPRAKRSWDMSWREFELGTSGSDPLSYGRRHGFGGHVEGFAESDELGWQPTETAPE